MKPWKMLQKDAYLMLDFTLCIIQIKIKNKNSPLRN